MRAFVIRVSICCCQFYECWPFCEACSAIAVFSLHFSSAKWYQVSSPVLICHPYTFFGEVSIQIFCLFLKIQLVTLLLNVKSFLYVLYKSFSRYVICKYFLLVCGLSYVSFIRILQRAMFVILIKSNLSYFLSGIMLLYCLWKLIHVPNFT